MKIKKYAVFFKYTDDEWYPAYRLVGALLDKHRLVKVSFQRLSNGIYRVCCWGEDDLGYDYDTESFLVAKQVVRKILQKDKININWLLKIGFIQA